MTSDSDHPAVPRSLFIKGFAAAALLPALFAVGCGGDDEKARPSDQAATSGTDAAGSGSTTGKPSTTDGGGGDEKDSPAGGGTSGGGTGSERPEGSAISESAPGYLGLFTAQVASGEDTSDALGRPGRWNLNMGTKNFTFSYGNRGFGGSLKASGDRLTFGAPTGAITGAVVKRKTPPKQTKLDPCNGAEAVYRWSVSDLRLELTPVGKDPCAGRRTVLTQEFEQKQ